MNKKVDRWVKIMFISSPNFGSLSNYSSFNLKQSNNLFLLNDYIIMSFRKLNKCMDNKALNLIYTLQYPIIHHF